MKSSTRSGDVDPSVLPRWRGGGLLRLGPGAHERIDQPLVFRKPGLRFDSMMTMFAVDPLDVHPWLVI
jgi:hypothetical protein